VTRSSEQQLHHAKERSVEVLPGARYPGLYRPEFEHDACGVGVVANIKGVKSHAIVDQGLEVLLNLAHRGACGSDPKTGDGAGLLLQTPDAFLRREALNLGITLPPRGQYGVAMLFLPQDAGERARCEAIFRQTVEEEGQRFLGWRDVPVDASDIGVMARGCQPRIRQAFVAQGPRLQDEADFERKLYVIRKVVERRVLESGIRDKDVFYIPSFSANRVVYKGLLIGTQLRGFYPDLSDPALASSFVLVHSRFSTNTLGSWKLAHPYRHICHNGEINTLRGNLNWMVARQGMMSSPLFGADLPKLFPIIAPGQSDTASIDNAIEFLLHTGRSIAHVMAMLIPEATGERVRMSQEKRDFYEYHACLMEPWDGPALIAFTDGTRVGAVLDRNGLRPFRYLVTRDDLLVMASEVGVLDVPPEQVLYKARIQPGRMFLLDPEQGGIVDDEALKSTLSRRRPYGKWLAANRVNLEELPPPPAVHKADFNPLLERQRAFGYTQEDLRMLLEPMAATGAEPVGSMGNDTPLAVLSDRPQLLFNYFKQLFAQVTNPPLDAIREELVTELASNLGSEENVFDETPHHAQQLRLPWPILTNEELEQVRRLDRPGLKTSTLSALFDVKGGTGEMGRALEALCRQASDAIKAGNTIIILSDRGVDAAHAAVPSLLAAAAVHHHLIREGARTRAGLVVESGEPREVAHFALLIGHGAGAVNPYLAYETLEQLAHQGAFRNGVDPKVYQKSYIKALDKGLLKIASKMGISTIQSYRGAQIFEAVGLSQELVNRYFTWTSSRVGGIGLEHIETDVLRRHREAYPETEVAAEQDLDFGGAYYWRRDGEYHMWNPDTVAKLQDATRTNNAAAYKEFAALANSYEQRLCTLRGLLEFQWEQNPIPLNDVEPASEIVKRFATGAISLGSISREAHETLAIAMNRIGARSNTGEGGEDFHRFTRDPNGDSRSSAIKQVASGRFGVTTNYLVNARDLQIKMAQGSKPGEGGQLPGHKIDEYIGWVRRSTPGVELISPPPHHDIYSIEDLAQLIHDLKNVNPQARINVKLVAEVGVGTIAAGVSKAHGDVVLISGDSGGTGASPESSIKHAGLPWELGLAETQQVLVQNDLRGRIVVQTDGQLKTGRDIAIACLLGAEEFGIATGALITQGCIMLRKCHLNTCSVGIATQDPELRKRFAGKPEYLINYFFFLAEELREIMARMGFRAVNEMVGRVDRLDTRMAIDHWKAKGLDLSPLLYRPQVPPTVATYHCQDQDHGLDRALDPQLIALAREALDHQKPVRITMPIRNRNRTVCTTLSGEVAKRYGEEGLPDDTIQCYFKGSAGQSFSAFLAKGISVTLEGDSNDYFGKGISGGRLVVFPPKESTFAPEANIIVGNVVLYGATGGEVFIRGLAGERFCVRNSGARAVVEGVGDHGCEYMTNGRVVVLGPTGRNFAAGMSGGFAFVLDEAGDFPLRCNQEMVDLEPLALVEDLHELRELIEKHLAYTGSSNAKRVLDAWDEMLPKFVKVYPKDYRRVLEARNRRQLEAVGSG
jgi:glutamate synthase domain-containing protein 2/glutamate synthase domain-containing protein 1/glutamate synthase domain-containing protein 3